MGVRVLQRFASLAVVCAALAGGAGVRAQSEVSALSAISAMPLASVAVATSAAAASVVVIPVALSTAGAVLVVKSIEVTAKGTVYLLERASDGAQVSIEIAGKTAGALSVGVGTALTVSIIGAGVVLSAAGEVVAFIPNELGKALLHNERVTR